MTPANESSVDRGKSLRRPSRLAPALLLVAGGNMVAVHICERCGAAIIQRPSDTVDRAAQHADWHAELAR
jgi:hypothetical protein